MYHTLLVIKCLLFCLEEMCKLAYQEIYMSTVCTDSFELASVSQINVCCFVECFTATVSKPL